MAEGKASHVPVPPVFSKAARSIGASVTLQLNARAAGMRAQGDPVIHLGGGEPKSLAPDSAVQAGVDMLRTGEIRYTPAAGTPAVRDAVIAYTEQFYGRKVERSNVLVSAGAKQAIMVALMALVDPGDEVVFPVPYWVSYPEMVRLVGGDPVPVRAVDGSFAPTVEEMVAALSGKTRAVLLNSPSNPCGEILSREFLEGIIGACEERGIHVLMDDIYHRLVYDGEPIPHAYQCTDRSVDDSRVVILNGVSKQYAMTGFRIGWAVGPRDLIRHMGDIQSHLSGGPCSISQVATVAALGGDQDSVDRLRDDLKERRDVMVSLLKKIPGLGVESPRGTFYCFADFRAFDENSTRLSERFLDTVQVVTVPGIEFGMEGYLRLSFCGPVEDVAEGVRRIRWLLDPEGTDTLKASGRIFRR